MSKDINAEFDAQRADQIAAYVNAKATKPERQREARRRVESGELRAMGNGQYRINVGWDKGELFVFGEDGLLEPPEITHDEELALHLYLQMAEDLSRQIRMVSGGKLTLAVAENAYVAPHVRDKAGIVTGAEWTGAHDYASRLGGYSVHQNEFTDRLFAVRKVESETSGQFYEAMTGDSEGGGEPGSDG